MAGKNTAVFGIYRDRVRVERTVDALKQEGFRSTDISVLFPDNQGTKDFAHEKSTKAPEGTAAGAGTGAVIGGSLGWLAGIGALAIPGVGPLIAAGPIVAALTGVGVGGAIGGITGALIGMGIPEYEAKRYEGRVSKEVCCCLFTQTIPNGQRRRNLFLNAWAPRMSHRPVKQRLISQRRISRCAGPADETRNHACR
jgi:hypothetical protein